jgi:urea transport system ATP-binding protein
MASLLYVDSLTVSFEGFLALRNLSLIVGTEERVRLVIGPNGAGKTTLFDVLTGHVRPSAGRAIFRDNVDLLGLRTSTIAALGVARKFQTPSVFPGHTVMENMILASGQKGFRATLAARPGGQERGTIAELLDQVGLLGDAPRLAGTLSHGEKQWLEIGMVIAQDPELLLVDEPVAGMTDEETARTGTLLQSIAADRSVLVIEHDMEFVRQIARKVTVLHQGTVLCEGPVDQVQSDPRVLEVYLGQRKEVRAEDGREAGGEERLRRAVK